MTRKKTQEKFISQFKEVHGDLYGLELVNYINNIIKIKLICKKHGIFKLQPIKALAGSGCQKCSTEKTKKTTKQVIQEFINIHGNEYDYELVDYNGVFKKVKIGCKKGHGIFERTPRDHKRGRGCPKCAKEKRNGRYLSMTKNQLKEIKPAFVYINKTNNTNEVFYKVGVSKKPKNRLYELNSGKYYKFTQEKLIETENMFDAVDLEQLILWETESYKPKNIFHGHTECFLIEHRKE